MSKRKKSAQTRRRQVLTSPMLGKSAIHEKSGKAIRRRDSMKLRKQWCPQSALGCTLPASLPAQRLLVAAA